MNHYQRLATMLVRFAAVVAIALGVLGIIAGIYLEIVGSTEEDRSVDVGLGILYLSAGFVVYRLSARIGKRIGRGLDE